jgi:hypothetical protein
MQVRESAEAETGMRIVGLRFAIGDTSASQSNKYRMDS